MDRRPKLLPSLLWDRFRRSSPAPSHVSNASEAVTKISFGFGSSDELPSSSPRSTEGAERPGGITRHQSARLSVTETNKALGKIELQIASGPQWVWIRRCMFSLFWVIVICMLVAALLIIVQAPECKAPPKLEWWQKGPMYRFVLKSYRDASGDGIGDIKGIIMQLQYIAQLNVVAIILVPYDKLNQTLQAPNGSSSFQYILDLKPFFKAASKYGIKVVLDFTPFSAPLGSDIWTSIDQDKDFLNTLLAEFHFGFRQGVDGIFLRISALNSKKTFMRELLKTWKEIASKFSSSSKKRIFIIGTNMEESDYFASVLVNVRGVIIFVYYLSDLLKSSKITEIALILNDYYQIVQNEWSGFSLSEGHIASMILQKHQIHFNLYAILLFTMPGTPLFYYGDEIALKDYKKSQYPPMRWNTSKYARFTKNVPWISPDFNPYPPTVSQQSEDPRSTLSLFRALAKIRIEESPLLYGDFYLLINTTNILAYIRQWNQMGILVVLNFGGSVTYNFTRIYLPSFAFLLSKSTELSQCELINLKNMTIEANVGYILKYFIPE